MRNHVQGSLYEHWEHVLEAVPGGPARAGSARREQVSAEHICSGSRLLAMAVGGHCGGGLAELGAQGRRRYGDTKIFQRQELVTELWATAEVDLRGL